jgi:thiol-disulfide isomerase/thioredoxin
MHTSNLYKKIILFFFFIILSINAFASEILKRLDNYVQFPNITVLDHKGNQSNLKFNKNLKTKGYVINFWATWCIPCKKELPDLSLLQSKIKKYDIEILTISIDKKNIEDQIKFLSKNGASNLSHFFDKKMSIFKSLKLRGIPTTVFVDNRGNVLSIHEGILKWGDDIIVRQVKDLFY